MRRLAAALTFLALLAPAAPAPARPSGSPGATAPAVLGTAVAQTAGPAPDEPEVTAEGAVLYDAADDRVLWGDGASLPLPPASTTKVMTVLLALEAGTLDDTVTVSAAAAEIGRRAGAATLGLQAGERIAMRSLLEGLVLRSGNDAAVAVAEHVAGSEAAFVERMNARAAQLGMTDTHFVNATGLTDDLAHHTSAVDLARLADVALQRPVFARWAATRSATVEGLGTLVNRNELLGAYEGATGVKTGYTNLAGLCLVASARRDGRPLIAVVLGSEASFSDAAEIFDYGFTAFRRAGNLRRGEGVGGYRWAGARVALRLAAPLGWTVPADQDAVLRLQLRPQAELPVRRGDVLGRAELLVDGAVVDREDAVAGGDVPTPGSPPAAAAVGTAVQEALRAFARLRPVDRPA